MEFAGVKEWQIHEGNAVKVEQNGVTIWKANIYDYGDGSLNTLSNGYNNTLYLNGVKVTSSSPATNTNSNFSGVPSLREILTTLNLDSSHFIRGNNSFTLTTPIDSSSGEKTIQIRIDCGGLTSDQINGGYTFKCDNVDYTLKQMVDNGIIKPIVLIDTGEYGGRGTNALNWYNGGNSTEMSFWSGYITFMLNKGYTITSIGYYSNKDTPSYDDGLQYVRSGNINDCRFTVAPY